MRRVLVPLLAVVVCVGSSTNALAQAAPKPSNLITLVAQTGVVTDCPDGGFGFAQQGDDGNFSAFAIPNKKVLVVTSFEWTGLGTANRYATATLSSQVTGGESLLLARSSVLGDSVGAVGGSHVIPNGVAVPAGRTVCLDSPGTPFAVLHGYLAKAK